MSKYKTSYGFALCRRNHQENNRIEILSIKKRCTYQFFSFINGFYKARPTRHNDSGYIKYMFDNMSFQEKLTILSMNYSTMWWYIWLNNPEKGIGLVDSILGYRATSDTSQTMQNYTHYFKRKCKFEKKFLQDGGKRMSELINNSRNCETIWEIPKGSQNANETELDTAIREFTEEANIAPAVYDLLYHADPVIITYKDNGVAYRHVYYLAELNETGYNQPTVMCPKINFKCGEQVSEVADVRWLSSDHIKMLEIPTKNKRYMLKLYGNIVSRYRKLGNKKYLRIKDPQTKDPQTKDLLI